ncbi:efflux RND transporter periplasmic adaptor subunit [Neobacillus niacini]|uniref:efflux RND transporter periplasmic adaptor subunit n=1 Tax=Neobacillus niacini TaxID=86668 RepID=UPI0005EE16E6|nr:efflux RND transporter periplasmic adaptor subunit [Neobacillus niacini]
MNWKKWTITIFITLFLAVNFFLTYKKDSKIIKTNYIDEWTAVKEQDLILAKKKAGVITPSEEQYVYFDDKNGQFQEFLVKKGEKVQEGTPLFAYSSTDIESSKANLEAEITRLESELGSIEENITQLESLKTDLSAGLENEEEVASNDLMLIEAEIYDKELQMGRIESEIEKYNTLIDSNGKSLDNLMIKSNVSGVVKEISRNLKNPLITISSDQQQVEGILEEEEVLEITEGMKVFVTSPALKKKKESTITEISSNPIEQPKVNRKSQYRFSVQLNQDSEEEIVNGAHVDLKIIKQEVNNVLTVPYKSIKNKEAKSYIYVLQQNGTIEKRSIQTGMHVNQVQEVKEGAEKGELIVFQPSTLKNNAPFFTPLNTKEIETNLIGKMEKNEILRYIGRGFLSN